MDRDRHLNSSQRVLVERGTGQSLSKLSNMTVLNVKAGIPSIIDPTKLRHPWAGISRFLPGFAIAHGPVEAWREQLRPATRLLIRRVHRLPIRTEAHHPHRTSLPVTFASSAQRWRKVIVSKTTILLETKKNWTGLLLTQLRRGHRERKAALLVGTDAGFRQVIFAIFFYSLGNTELAHFLVFPNGTTDVMLWLSCQYAIVRLRKELRH